MCLAIPGKVIEIFEEGGLKMGRIDYAGTVQTACLVSVPEVQVGQFVLVHAGFALNVVDEEEARKTLELWDEIAAVNAEEGLDPFGFPLEDAGEENQGA